MELQFDYVKVESNQLTFDLEMQHKVLPKLPKADPELSLRTVPGPHRKTAGDKEAFLFVTFGLVEEFTGESRYEAVVVVGAHDRVTLAGAGLAVAEHGHVDAVEDALEQRLADLQVHALLTHVVR